MSKNFSSLIIAIIFVFALSGAVKAETLYAYLNSAQEVPTNASTGTGYARVVINESALTITWTVVFTGLTSNQSGSHIHAPAPIGANSGVIVNFPPAGGTSGTLTGSGAITATQIAQLRAGQGYVNIHTANFGGGEIRGQLNKRRPVDYDGDGRTDFSVLRFPNVAPPGVAQSTFYNQNSTSGFQAANWGNANTDLPAPGDYDGDGRDDLALYRAGAAVGNNSAFLILRSSDNTALLSTWGLNGDAPVARDYDGDGKTDVAVFRKGATVGSQATWLILQSSNSAGRIVPWGTTGAANGSTGDTPIPADYDGDGKFDLAVYRFGGLAPNNSYLILRSSDGTASYQQWGNFTTDYILPGDYDGDGKADLCVARTGASTSTQVIWYILQSSNNQLRAFPWGITSDLPVQGDYDGDGRTDLAMYRRGATATSNSLFWVYNSLSNTAQATPWGLQPDFPIATFDAR